VIAGEFVGWFAESSVAVAALVLVVLAVRKPIARAFGPEAAYLLWLAPALRLLTPELSILPPGPAPIMADGAAETVLLDAVREGGVANSADFAVAAFRLWFVGALLFIAVEALRQSSFKRRLLAAATPASREIAALASDVAAELRVKNPPRLMMSADGAGPLVVGLRRPVVVLPADFEIAWSPIERRLALAHELAHVRRGDLPATLAALVFRAAQWPNPIVHFAFRAFRADQEAACDAMVIARHSATPEISYAYGAALVKSARRAVAAPAASLAMSNHLKERLMLMKMKAKPLTAKTRIIAAALIAGAVAATASYSHAANEEMKSAVRVVKGEKSESKVSVVSAYDGETLEIAGVDGAKTIEVRTKNGVRTVRIWDKTGKLVSERKYGPEDVMPYKTIVIVGADGKRKTMTLGAEAEDFEWEEELLGPEAGERKVVILKHGDEIIGDGDPDCEPMEMQSEVADEDAERRVMKNVICIKGGNSKDPAVRAEALKKAIDHMEATARREAEHREKMLAKLRAELAAAEREAARE